jgi:CPA2 family monovalent cation:H+ antiporter-2
MNIESLITDLAFILLLGAVVTVLFKWIKQPVVLGYIVAGFLASPHFQYLPSVADEANIEFWAQIGIVVLLFSLGLEFSFKKLVSTGGSAVVTALIIVTGMMVVGFTVGHFMGFTTINSLFLGGMLSMSSTTIIIKAFNDLGLRQKKFTSMVLAVLIVEDLFAVVMMVILSSIAINNSVQGGDLLMSIIKLIFFLVMWFLVGVFVLPTALNRIRKYLNSETLLIVSMGLCLGMAVFSVYCGFSLALGAFVMGSILAGTSYAERIEHVVMPVKDLFGSVFFISVGMMVNPAIIAEFWQPILLLSAVVIVGMITFGSFGMLVTGQTLKVAIEAGFSLTQIGEFAFIIATLGMSLGVLDANIYPIVVAVSVLTTFTTPYFIKMADPFYNIVERHLPARLRFLIDRFHDNASTEQAKNTGWMAAAGRYIWRTVIYTILLVSVMLVGNKLVSPWAQQLFPEWGHLITAGITLACMSPFLVAMLSPVSYVIRSIAGDSRTPTNIPIIVVAVFSFLIAIGFVSRELIWAFSMKAAGGFILGAVVLLVLIFSRRVRERMRSIETRFIDNLNERDLRRSGKNNNIISDLHLAYMTVGNGCSFVGEKLKNSNLRTRYGINIVSIQRGASLITIPGSEARLYPGDVIGVIGTDEQLERLLKDVEVERDDAHQTTRPADFGLCSFMLSDHSPLAGKTARSVKLRDNYDAVLVAVQREGEYVDIDPDFVFNQGDILWLVGDKKALAAVQ